jgi:hypothetical protein
LSRLWDVGLGGRNCLIIFLVIIFIKQNTLNGVFKSPSISLGPIGPLSKDGTILICLAPSPFEGRVGEGLLNFAALTGGLRPVLLSVYVANGVLLVLRHPSRKVAGGLRVTAGI